MHLIKLTGILILTIASCFYLQACGQTLYETHEILVPTGSVSLTWDPPIINSDDSPLTDLTGYWIYCRPETGLPLIPIQVSDPLTTQRVITGLRETRWYFEVTAYNSLGYQSNRSSPITTVIVAD